MSIASAILMIVGGTAVFILCLLGIVCIVANEVIKLAARKYAEDAGYRDADGDIPRLPTEILSGRSNHARSNDR